jgi:hypothetical protein
MDNRANLRHAAPAVLLEIVPTSVQIVQQLNISENLRRSPGNSVSKGSALVAAPRLGVSALQLLVCVRLDKIEQIPPRRVQKEMVARNKM